MKPNLSRLFARPGAVTLTAVPDGLTGKLIADLVAASRAPRLLFVARDGQRLAEVQRALAFFAPDIEALEFPAWDCLPYDRVSPHAGIVARRMATLARLAAPAKRPQAILTTVNAALQRAPERGVVASGSITAEVGHDIAMDDLIDWLEVNGFLRSPTVRETQGWRTTFAAPRVCRRRSCGRCRSMCLRSGRPARHSENIARA